MNAPPAPGDIFRQHLCNHAKSMKGHLQRGRLRQALAITQPQATCGESCRAELLETLQLDMLTQVLAAASLRKPEYLARSDVKDVLSRLMAVESLQTNLIYVSHIFDRMVKLYYPDNVNIFFDTFTLHIHDDTRRQKFWKNVRSAVERRLYGLLHWMEFQLSGSKENLRELQKTFSDLIQAMAVPLHDDTVPVIPYDSAIQYGLEDGHYPLFTRAVKLNLTPEALLLYDTGAVGNKELGLLAKDPDVHRMLASEEDKSVLAVFLRKVLHKPRSLECLATMQVSRLLWCHAPPDKEQKAREMGLLDFQVERVLLRRQCGRYRAALKQADEQAVKAGASQ